MLQHTRQSISSLVSNFVDASQHVPLLPIFNLKLLGPLTL